MEFAKETAVIPDCCRLSQRFNNLNPTVHLESLPSEHMNQNKNARRKKWSVLNHFNDKDHESDIYYSWPELKELFDGFPGSIEYAHISLLPAGGILKVHRDGYGRNVLHRPQFPLFNCTLRFHIPLMTNNDCVVYCEDRFYHMDEGECWMLNNFSPHAAVNEHSSQGRYHLIFDVKPNHDTMKLIDEADETLGYEDVDFFDRHWPELLIQNR